MTYPQVPKPVQVSAKESIRYIIRLNTTLDPLLVLEQDEPVTFGLDRKNDKYILDVVGSSDVEYKQKITFTPTWKARYF